MMYLVSQLWVWLLLALIIGLVVGWLTCSQEPTRWWVGWVPWGTFAFLIGLAVAVLRLVPDGMGYLLDSALLMFASYIIGCCIGCLVRQWLKRGEYAGLATAGAGAAGALVAPKVAAPAPRPASAPVAPAPVAPAPIAPAPQPKPAPAPVVKVAEPVPAPAAVEEPQPEIDVPAGLPGRRPRGLMGPRGGKADDLKRIRGIGRQNEGRLHALGIWHFDQIAAWVREEIDWVGSYLAFPGRIDREEWIAQAKVLATGAETEFSKRVDRGEIATSKDGGDKGQANVADLTKITNATPKAKG